MKRIVGFMLAAFLLGGITGVGVTLLLGGAHSKTQPEIVRALRTSRACPDQPTQGSILENKTIYFILSPPVQAENGDWYAECRENVVTFGKSYVTSWLCFRVKARSLGVNSVATPDMSLSDDAPVFGWVPQNTPCDTIAGWPKP